MLRPALLAGLCLVLSCGPAASGPEAAAPAAEPVVLTGAHRLASDDFALLRGQRVGLITNHTARVDSVHVIDLLYEADGVTLAALFGPEHGLRGLADAGEHVSNGIDDATGVPVYSLYGETRKPSAASLEGLDVLVFDIQDVGARFYTYISTMGLAMQAAAEQGLPFVVLDRPNAIGGARTGGFVLEPASTSFVGQYPIPVAHGLTVGELAGMIRGEAWLPGLEQLDLTVVEMEGWERAMLWPETGLPWIKTSPNIPDFETALIYPGACFFEGTNLSEGRGTQEPFKVVGAPWGDAEAFAQALNARNLPGVRFEPARFTPLSIEGMSSNPKLQDQRLEGVRQVVTDPDVFLPVETGVHLLHAFYSTAPEGERADLLHAGRLGRLAGTDRLYEMLTAGATAEAIIGTWADETAAFEALREPYLLY